MKSADLTIAIATYNGGAFVGKAVQSALDTGAHVVVSDDNSIDNTQAVLDAYTSVADIRYQPRNLGIGGQYEFLLATCTTPLMMLLNQDDVLVAASVAALPLNCHEVTVLNGWVIDAHDVRVRRIYRRPPFHATLRGVYAGLLVENFVRSPSQVIFPTRLAREAGGFHLDAACGQGAEDWIFWLRMASAGLRFKLRLRPAMAYRTHAANYSRNTESLAASRRSVREQTPAAPSRDHRLSIRW